VPLWTPEHTPPRSSSPSTALHASCPQPTPGHQPTVSAHSPLALLVLPLRLLHLFLHRARPSAIRKRLRSLAPRLNPPVRLVSSCVSSALPRRREICRTACPSPPRRTGNQTVCTSSALRSALFAAVKSSILRCSGCAHCLARFRSLALAISFLSCLCPANHPTTVANRHITTAIPLPLQRATQLSLRSTLS
jgi:hypothetical protein